MRNLVWFILGMATAHKLDDRVYLWVLGGSVAIALLDCLNVAYQQRRYR